MSIFPIKSEILPAMMGIRITRFHPIEFDRFLPIQAETGRVKKRNGSVTLYRSAVSRSRLGRVSAETLNHAVNPSEDHPVPENGSGRVGADFFLAFENLVMYPDEQVKVEMEKMKEEIAMTLRITSDESWLKLKTIDVIQRLGLSYLFDDEIKASLLNIYNNIHHHHHHHQEEEENLHTVALRFRLLRNQGHPVSTEILKKFLDNEGKWDKSSTMMDDLEGILSLYEASHYMVHGENILEEALIFTETALKWMLSSNTSDSVACSKINHALKWPIRKTMNRWATRLFITLYQQDESHDGVLLKLAKLDFNALQRMHKRELCALIKWWKSKDGVGIFGFVRDKRVEAYFGALALLFEPRYSQGRMRLAKQISLTTIMDDAYDEYGTMDELLLFTQAIQRYICV